MSDPSWKPESEAKSGPTSKQLDCPICSKPAASDFRPFCSKRCADVDLQRWFSGRYAIPVADGDEEERPGADDGEA